MKNNIPKASIISSLVSKFEEIRCSLPQESAFTTGGRPPKISMHDLISGLVWHVLQPSGYFSHHLSLFTGIKMSDSALSERRQSLGSAPWLETLNIFLRRNANSKHQPHAFYKGLRLIGIDGTTLNVANTPSIKTKANKTKTRRGKAAFHRISCVAAVELGTHSPIALRIGEAGESEGALATTILSSLESDDLVIGDRYYGNGKYAGRLLSLPQKPKFLVRVQERFNSVIVKKLKDRSKLVKVKEPVTGDYVMLRQIKAKVRRQRKRWVNIRLWTNLLDPVLYPANELILLYRIRWEHEIAFREFKEYLHDDNVLLSHTIITAVQEICALFMAQSIVANTRLIAANGQNIQVLQISFLKTLDACRNLCWLSAVAGNIITAGQFKKIAHLTEIELGRQASKKRRQRSCPRKVRQPINKWPRMIRNRYAEGKFEHKIRN